MKRDYRESHLDAIWHRAQDRHKRAAGAILAALMMGDESPEAFLETAFILSVRLTEIEIAGVAYAALRALDPEPREMVFEAVHWGEISGAGMPVAPLSSFKDEASWWADLASEPELKSYLLACWSRLSSKVQADFLRHIDARPI